MKMRMGTLSETNRRDMTALSFGVASAAPKNADPGSRLVPVRLMAVGQPLRRESVCWRNALRIERNPGCAGRDGPALLLRHLAVYPCGVARCSRVCSSRLGDR